jgi:uncharacterized damage-inducible protein DinB
MDRVVGRGNRIYRKGAIGENCRSVQTMMSHVVSAGYTYADYIRGAFSVATNRPARRLLSHAEALQAFDAMLAYTIESLDGQWELTDPQIQSLVMPSRWGVTYDLEQLLEHAIVHVLRHRRQIERLCDAQSVTTHAGG